MPLKDYNYFRIEQKSVVQRLKSAGGKEATLGRVLKRFNKIGIGEDRKVR